MLQRFKTLSGFKKLIVSSGIVGILGFLALQIFPAGRFASSLERHENPPITRSIVWTSSEAEAIARKACYDCHSNETKWPWYSKIAPMSWLVTWDVNNGRAALNFSEYDPSHMDDDDFREHVYEDMPPPQYLPMHPEAKLTDAEREILIAAFMATLNEDEGRDREDEHDDDNGRNRDDDHKDDDDDNHDRH